MEIMKEWVKIRMRRMKVGREWEDLSEEEIE